MLKNKQGEIMTYQEIVHCGRCGAPIRFIRTKKGKQMPVNAKPMIIVPVQKGGHTFITLDGEVFQGLPEEKLAYYDGVDSIAAYECHFATCPASQVFRKKK